MSARTSPAGRAALMRREGCRLTAYRDSVGVETIGVGHTGRASPPAVTPGMTITAAEAEVLLARDLAPIEAAVNRAVTVPLTVNQFDACVSLAFNIGAVGFAGSTVVRELNAGDAPAAADAFLQWVHPPELRRRRIDERAQFLRPDGAPQPTAAPALVPAPLAVHIDNRRVARPGLLARLLSALTRKAA